jgi:hypothetical protein
MAFMRHIYYNGVFLENVYKIKISAQKQCKYTTNVTLCLHFLTLNVAGNQI